MIFLSILIFILAMSLPFFKTQITPIFFTRITALAFIYAGVLTFNALHIQSIGSGIGIYSGFFQVTYFSLFIETFLYVVGALILLSWPLLKKETNSLSLPTALSTALPTALQIKKDINLESELSSVSSTYLKEVNLSSVGPESKEYSLIVLFSILGGSLLLSSGDLLSMYLSIELQSFGVYILATIYRDSNSATGAGLKYFLLGGLSSCLILLGASLIYSFTGLTNFESIYSLISVISMTESSLHNLELGSALSEGGIIQSMITEKENIAPLYNSIEMLNTSSASSPEKVLNLAIDMPNTNLTKNYESVSLIDNLNTGIFPNPKDLNNFSITEISETPNLPLIGLTHDVISSINNNIIPGVSLGLILIVVGFLFKIAAAPFHNWAPDVYDESPTNVTIWLTIMPKISIVIFLLELEMGIASQITLPLLNTLSSNISDLGNTLSLLNSQSVNEYETVILSELSSQISQTVMGGSSYILKNLLLLSSLISLILGTVVGLAQTRIKRLLAYSTISHVGFLLLALAINTEQSTESLVLYLIQYIITSLNTFFILLAFGYILSNSSYKRNTLINLIKEKSADIRFIVDLKGQFIANPILSLSLVICLFSMAGVPPLMGFFGKLSVLYAAIANGYFFMALIAIIVSVISAYYYLRIIRELHTETTPDSSEKVSQTLPDTLHSRLENLKEGENIPNPIFPNSNPFSKSPGILPENTMVVLDSAKDYKKNIHSTLILTNIHSFFIATLTLSILFFVLKPSIILNSTVLLSLSLFNV